jgi:hypothetical protein
MLGNKQIFEQRPQIDSTTAAASDNNDIVHKKYVDDTVSTALSTIEIPDLTDVIQKSDLYLNGDSAYDMRLNYQQSGSTTDVVDKSSTYIRGYFMDTGTATNNYKNVAIGNVARVKSYENTAIGYSAQIQSNSGVAIGHAAVITGYNSVAVGVKTETGTQSIAVGSGTKVTGTGSIGIGTGLTVTGSYITMIGTDDTTTIKLGPLSITFSGDNIIFTKNSKTFTMNMT